MSDYDLAIIGAGSGNTIPVDVIGEWRTVIFEDDRFGGTCLNRGCIPSKMLVHSADVANYVRRAAPFGIEATVDSVDWPSIRDRIFGKIDPLHQSAVDYRRQNGVDVITEPARFVGAHEIEAGGKRFTADRIVIASGSRPSVPDIDGLEDVPYETSDTVMRIERLPESMLVIGGGYVGVEMAHVFGALGTRITLATPGPSLLSKHDHDVRARFTDLFAATYDVRLSTSIEHIERVAGGVRALLASGDVVETEAVLLATGRVPNTDRLDVSAAGVNTDQHGHIIKDDTGRTSVEGIWALGDASNHFQLKHMANAEARVVWNNIGSDGDTARMHYPVVPSAVFSDPQVATVGATEEQLVATGSEYTKAFRSYGATAYGWALQDETSFVKVMADPSTRLLLGAHIIGPEASILIQPLVQAMQLGNTVDEVGKQVIYLHPALSEVIEQVLLEL